ncbi:hypothetical protein DL96DRAFT_1561854 [Flagelloscypha sp. PMI_526]|nr:hypothetical protein DL96DRAFT_1561854 [Flagelloscypha sp. PMI_526]
MQFTLVPSILLLPWYWLFVLLGTFTSRVAQPSDADNIVTVSKAIFDSSPGATTASPKANPICGKESGSHLDARPLLPWFSTLPAPGSIDLPLAAFDALDDPAVGRVNGVT